MKALPIYQEQMDILSSLPEEGMAHVIKAMFAYAQDKEIPELEVWEKALFDSFKISIDKSKAKAENGAKGGSKSEASDKQTEANDKQTQANESKPEARNKQEEINEKEQTRRDKESNSSRTPSAKASDFDRLWELYPRKEGKQAAFEAYKRAIHDGTPIQVIEDGIKRYKEHLRIKRTEPRFIKQGATFFRQRAWMDVFDDSPPRDVVDRGMDFMQRDDDMSDVLMEL